MNKQQNNPQSKAKTGVYLAPWEKSFDKILTPFEEFIHRQTTSGFTVNGHGRDCPDTGERPAGGCLPARYPYPDRPQHW